MTIILSQQQIKDFQKEILDWYRKNQRDLPWRKSHDPYSILISEVMSQQTQISRVVPKYEVWMEKFPTLQSLAEAPTSEVLRYWSGLGYNRRALYLQRLAKELVGQSSLREVKRRSSPGHPSEKGLPHKQSLLAMTQKEHVWPQTEEELKKLPGIGEYTARAILCFAFDRQIAVVDTNVRKVILVRFKDVILNICEGSQLADRKEILRFTQNDKEKQIIQNLATELLPKGRAYEWNQALMDYAAAELKAHKIPLPKQSKFNDSDRYYRGQILKVLLEKHSVSEEELQALFLQKISDERMKKVLLSLKKDLFIVVKKGKIELC